MQLKISMDKKASKPKTKLMKFLPISPGKENRPLAARLFSGPTKVSIIPQEARSKSNKSGYATPEPTSPKVSCIGQIKKKKKMKGLATAAAALEVSEPKKRPHPPSLMKRIWTGGKVPGRAKSEAAAAPAVGLSQMKRFSSGRGALANFDWTTAQVAPADDVEVGPLQPRKEVNIWKRRTVVQPTPLQL